MLTGVKFEGLAAGQVSLQGPEGPVDLQAGPQEALAVFRLQGWDTVGPEATEDEKQGHEVCLLMQDVGDAHADGKWTADEALRAVVRVEPRYASIIGVIMPVAEEAFRRVADDGRLDRKDALALAWRVASSVGHQLLDG